MVQSQSRQAKPTNGACRARSGFCGRGLSPAAAAGRIRHRAVRPPIARGAIQLNRAEHPIVHLHMDAIR